MQGTFGSELVLKNFSVDVLGTTPSIDKRKAEHGERAGKVVAVHVGKRNLCTLNPDTPKLNLKPDTLDLKPDSLDLKPDTLDLQHCEHARKVLEIQVTFVEPYLEIHFI